MSDPSAQFVIDIAAEMSGGAQTTEDLDRLTANLMGGGKGADHFQQALVQVSQVLDAARAATAGANDALAKGQTEYRALEQAANQAAKAAEKAALSGKSGPDMGRTARLAAEAVDAQAAALKKLESAAAAASAKEDALSKTFKNVQTLSAHVDTSLKEQAATTGALKKSLGELGGPLGSIGKSIVAPVDAFNKLSKSIGAENATMIVAAAGAAAFAAIIVVVVAAVIAATVAVTAWAVSLADSARSASLTSDAMQALHPELVRLGPAMIDAAKATGAHTDELQALAGQLRDAKVAAADMPAALKAAALAEAALGKGGSKEFLDQLKEGKKSVAALSAEFQSKLGGIVAKQMLGLTAQAATFKTNIAGVFGGLNIEPLLSGLATIVALFDKDTASGAALKFMFEGLFQPLIDGATRLIPYIVRAFLTLEIWALKAYIFVKPAIKAFEDSGAAATVFKGVLIAVGLAAALALAPIGILISTFVAVQAAIAGVLYAGYQLAQWLVSVPAQVGGAFNAALAWIQGISWADVGAAIMHGLATGITGSAAAVWHAITGAVGGAIDAAKNMLGIHSPSKVFAEIGANTVAGFTGAVDDGAPEAQNSLASMVSPASATAAAAAPSAKPSATAAPSKGSFAGAIFNFYGAGSESDAKSFAEQLTRLLEGDASQLGAEPSPA